MHNCAPVLLRGCLSIVAHTPLQGPAAPSGADSLVGAEGAFELRIVDVPRLKRAATVLRAERHFLRLCPKWPETLRRCLPAACHRMRDAPPSMLQSLADELAAPHVPQLLAHKDNVQRRARPRKERIVGFSATRTSLDPRAARNRGRQEGDEIRLL
eukprot:6104629-Pleurochrysis_carterae.AAC.4